jgi:hypothetical protein
MENAFHSDRATTPAGTKARQASKGGFRHDEIRRDTAHQA